MILYISELKRTFKHFGTKFSLKEPGLTSGGFSVQAPENEYSGGVLVAGGREGCSGQETVAIKSITSSNNLSQIKLPRTDT